MVNDGLDYLYGELFEDEGCLRITYIDEYGPDGIPDGVWIIWPPGFTGRIGDGVIHVIDQNGRLAASTGDMIRISGVWPWHPVDAADWDWSRDPIKDCAGPHWPVGYEVSAVTDEPRHFVSDTGIFLPRLRHQAGPKQSPAALAPNHRVALRGNCIRLESSSGYPEPVVVWPPGFRVEAREDQIVVVTGGGQVIARVGDGVRSGDALVMGGGTWDVDFPEAPECSGTAWNAFTVNSK